MSNNINDIRISTYVNIEQAIELKKIAQSLNQSMAEFVRQVLLEEIARRNK